MTRGRDSNIIIDTETTYHLATVCVSCGPLAAQDSPNRSDTHSWLQAAQAHAMRTMHVVRVNITRDTVVAPSRRYRPAA